MELTDLLEDSCRPVSRIEELLTWFYNLVMQLEAIQQWGAEP